MHLPLKQEHGGQRFGPKNHRLYRIATSPEDLPNDVVEWIRATTEDARYMFARIPWTEGATELFQALRPYMRRLKSRAQGSMPTAKLLQAIFFNTLSRLASFDKEVLRYPLHAHCGARGQRELTQALLFLSPASRSRLSRIAVDAFSDPDERSYWMAQMSGAYAVTKTAFAFHGLGAQVWGSTTHEDVGGKIDLIATSPRWRAGICLTISSQLETHGRLLDDRSVTPDVRDFWNGVQRFGAMYLDRPWLAVVLNIKRRGAQDHDLRQRTLQSVIEQVVRGVERPLPEDERLATPA